MVGVRILRPAIWMMGDQGAEEVGVDTVHDFRPEVDYLLGMTEKMR